MCGASANVFSFTVWGVVAAGCGVFSGTGVSLVDFFGLAESTPLLSSGVTGDVPGGSLLVESVEEELLVLLLLVDADPELLVESDEEVEELLLELLLELSSSSQSIPRRSYLLRACLDAEGQRCEGAFPVDFPTWRLHRSRHILLTLATLPYVLVTILSPVTASSVIQKGLNCASAYLAVAEAFC
jgi:hypothetical protein